MTTIAQAIRQFVAQAHENYKQVLERYTLKAATANNDLMPTVDRHGRLHAPCDGYEWELEIYQGGAYLPFPMEFWERLSEQTGKPCGPNSSKYVALVPTHRIKSNLQEFEEIKQACGSFAEVTAGKVWDDGESCYVYIKSSRNGLIDLVADYRAEQEAAIKAQRDAEKAAKQSLKGEAPEGRCVVKGRVLCFKRVERAQYGYYDSGVDYKMLVELENLSTVWGTQPTSEEIYHVGDMVEFTATFERSAEDKTHAFYKRPAKFKVIKEGV